METTKQQNKKPVLAAACYHRGPHDNSIEKTVLDLYTFDDIYYNGPPSPVILPRYPSYCPFSHDLKCQTNVAVLPSPSTEEPFFGVLYL